MNEITQSRDTHKRLAALVASLLFCFALVMSMVPVQAIAADGADDTTQGDTQTPGGNGADDGTGTPGTTPGDTGNDGDTGDTTDPDEPEKTVEVAIPTPAANLTYTGSPQKLLAQNKGYSIELVIDEESTQAEGDENTPAEGDENQDATDEPTAPKLEIDVETDKDNVLATNAGTYTFKVTLNKGYVWKGGGTADQVIEVKIAPANINKATTATVSDATFFGDPVTPKVVVKMANDTTLVENTDYTLEYVDNDAIGTATVIIRGEGNFEGTKVANFEVIEHQIMYRVYNPNSGEHFYTASVDERDHLIEVGWKNENIGWYAPTKSSKPVYRLYNPNAGEHHYTLDVVEHDALIKDGWNDEGIGWYSDENETVPVLRQYNPNAFANNHNYTTSEYEFTHNIDLGWQDEGIGWYAAKAAEE